MEDYQFNNKWNVWYHSINDNRWSNDSYTNVFNISNLYDFKAFKSVINDKILHKCMFFLMKDNIFPTWEDENNKNGCCVSYKISNKTLYRDFYNILLNILIGNIMKNKDNENIVNGISISPKKEFNIIKIWFKNCISISEIREIKPSFINSKCILKSNN
tara:strand:- start:57 stop:533 length:477 start_codon:yes stop_codon:yes gene_type:complete